MKTKKLKTLVLKIWIRYYIFELEKYLVLNGDVFTTQHGFVGSSKLPSHTVSLINDAHLAYWHLGRLGILTLAPQEIGASDDKMLQHAIRRSADWIKNTMRLNPASLRPIIDLHHIEIFSAWLVLWQAGYDKEIYLWLSELEARLAIRRFNEKCTLPFIESNSRLDYVVEFAITHERPADYSDSSSYLLTMILEIICSLNGEERNELLARFCDRVINGKSSDGKKLTEPINLVSWVPPQDWEERILDGAVWDGIAITTDNFSTQENGIEPDEICQNICTLVEGVRKEYPFKLNVGIPHSVFILACIKNQSPLPPEFWRGSIFPKQNEDVCHGK